METSQLNNALSDVTEDQLSHLGRMANRILAGRPFAFRGHSPRGHNSGRGMEFLDFRDYSPGDDLRHINWRASARSHYPLIQRYHEETASHWTICLDTSASMAIGNKWTLAIQLAASFAYLILQQENQIGLLAFNDQLQAICSPGRGRLQYGKIRRQLQTLLPLHAGGNSSLQLCGKSIKRGSSLIIISDFLTPDGMQSDLDYLKTFTDSIHNLQVTSHNEFKLRENSESSGQSHIIQDIESKKTFQINQETAEQLATQRLQKLQKNLRRYCQRHGMPYTNCTVGQSWHQIMKQHLQMFYQRPGR